MIMQHPGYLSNSSGSWEDILKPNMHNKVNVVKVSVEPYTVTKRIASVGSKNATEEAL